jgi:surface antigen
VSFTCGVKTQAQTYCETFEPNNYEINQCGGFYMKVTVFRTGLLLCALTFVSATQHASAAPSQDDLLALGTTGVEQKLAFASEITDQVALVVAEDQAAEPKVPRTYVVAKGDSLVKIAEQHQTTWQRVFDKNAAIINPDVISVGTTIVIPEAEETLPPRALPAASAEPAPVQAAPRARTARAVSARSSAPAGNSAGNRYVRGYCTWYAKNRRPDLPNNLGNANTWVSRASAQGLSTGSTPRVGAIGQQGMHVVYVEQVHGDGTITVSEMNWNGWNVISSRRASASSFQYIY